MPWWMWATIAIVLFIIFWVLFWVIVVVIVLFFVAYRTENSWVSDLGQTWRSVAKDPAMVERLTRSTMMMLSVGQNALQR